MEPNGRITEEEVDSLFDGFYKLLEDMTPEEFGKYKNSIRRRMVVMESELFTRRAYENKLKELGFNPILLLPEVEKKINENIRKREGRSMQDRRTM